MRESAGMNPAARRMGNVGVGAQPALGGRYTGTETSATVVQYAAKGRQAHWIDPACRLGYSGLGMRKRRSRNTAAGPSRGPRTAARRAGESAKAPASRRSRELAALGGILLVGLLLRGLYLRELTQQPDFTVPAIDAGFHDYWARALAFGDWTPPTGCADPQIRATPYLRPPGYPWFLSLVYRLTGPGYVWPRVVQMGLGLVAAALAYVIGRRWYGAVVGVTWAALMALYWAFIYFEGEFHAPALVIPLLLGAVGLLGLWAERRVWPIAAGAGAVLGFTALALPNLLLYVPAVVLWACWAAYRQRDWRGMGVALPGFGVAAILVIAPATIRNYRVAHDVVLITSNAGINLFLGNHEGADGKITDDIPGLGQFATCYDYPALVAKLEARQGRAMKHSEVSAYFSGLARSFMREHPWEFVKLTVRKAGLFWGPREITHNKAVACERRASAVLGWLPGSFAGVLSLAVLGGAVMFNGRRRHGQEARAGDVGPGLNGSCQDPSPPSGGGQGGGEHGRNPTLLRPLPGRDGGDVSRYERFNNASASIYERPLPHGRGSVLLAPLGALMLVLVVTYFLSVLPFFASARYRVPMIPFLMFFGAHGVGGLIALTRSGRVGQAALWAAGTLAVYVLAGGSPAPLATDQARWHCDRGVAYERRGQIEQAVAECRLALEASPGFKAAEINLVGALGQRGDLGEAIARAMEAVRENPNVAALRNNLALTLAQAGRTDEAIEHYSRAVELQPDLVEVHFNLAGLLMEQGRFDEAVIRLSEVVRLRPDSADGHFQLADALRAVGRLNDAEPHYRRVVALDPGRLEAHLNLGAVLAARGQNAEAAAAFEQALKIAPGSAAVHNGLGTMQLRAGDWRAAEEHYRAAIRLDPSLASARSNLGLALQALGRTEEAIQTLTEAVRLVPGNPEAHFLLGASLKAAGRLDEAVAEYHEALRLNPAHARARQALEEAGAGR